MTALVAVPAFAPPASLSPASASPLVGRHVTLRAIAPGDYPYLYELSTSEDIVWRWRMRGATPSPEQFAQLLWQQVLAQFLVESTHGKERVGHVTAYNANFQHGWCYLAALAAPSSHRTGWMMEAVALFVSYLFAAWTFRKIYIETVEFNFEQFASGVGKYFEIEGHLKEHEYYQGRYWDSYLLSLTRTGWEKRARFILPLIVPPRVATGESR